jgi:hypothetical protein
MKSVGDADAFFDKAVEGAVLFALNQRYVQLLLVY